MDLQKSEKKTTAPLKHPIILAPNDIYNKAREVAKWMADHDVSRLHHLKLIGT